MITVVERFAVSFQFHTSGCLGRQHGERKEDWDDRCESHICDAITSLIYKTNDSIDVECMGRCAESFAELRFEVDSRLEAQSLHSAIDGLITKMGGCVL